MACALISIAVGIGILLVAAEFFVFHRSSKWKSQMGGWSSVFFYPLRITEHDLVMAMDEKSAVGSGGAFGRVYTISLPSGELVAVKKLVNIGSQTSKALKAEVRTLAKIRHKSRIKVLGFCHSDESVFLIYECLQKGSLGDMIGGTDWQLQWSVRLRIAIGVAQGLAYLHKDYVPHLLHRNVKSKNILLDTDFEPKLTDFALDRLVGEAAFRSTIASESADSCYSAPELGYSKKATEQMDVYSFGVVLLELITGRQAEQAEPVDSLDIVKWVRRKINITNGAIQVLDSKISNSYQQEMLGALDIAIRCTSVIPEKRPSMVEVVRGVLSLSPKTQLPGSDFSMQEGFYSRACVRCLVLRSLAGAAMVIVESSLEASSWCFDFWLYGLVFAQVAVLGWAILVVDNGQAMEEDGDGCSVKRLYSPKKIDEVEAFDLMVAEAGDHQANNEYTLVGRLLTVIVNFSAMRFGIESLFDSIFHPVDLHRVIDGGRWSFNNHLLVTHHLQPREDPFIVELNEALF
ncbi:probably inactive leucine-rich repeat receptor-like protein kinase At5g06940 [Hevea brasiliensis]|uniref:probably inactive leucine-rich repeat receptor-like protein kinase At5g06940 n=1 Tax=Hevea brasiliensis TaxID=3981 RepID=UPI0025EDDB9D|nr:probably inactive leucine-rich repeat receptor-like protein kinase At5g06940 [Hevea brasiliensis]